MEIVSPDSTEAFIKANRAMAGGGIVAYPTETFYALGVYAFNVDALKRLFAVKERGYINPISILVKDLDMLSNVAEKIPHVAEKMISRFWPGPLTIIFSAVSGLPSVITAGTGKIGVRISSHPVASALIKETGTPITATSANLHGEDDSMSIEDVGDYFGDNIDMIINGGRLCGRKASTIVDVTGNDLRVVREGAIDSRLLSPYQRRSASWAKKR